MRHLAENWRESRDQKGFIMSEKTQDTIELLVSDIGHIYRCIESSEFFNNEFDCYLRTNLSHENYEVFDNLMCTYDIYPIGNIDKKEYFESNLCCSQKKINSIRSLMELTNSERIAECRDALKDVKDYCENFLDITLEEGQYPHPLLIAFYINVCLLINGKVLPIV